MMVTSSTLKLSFIKMRSGPGLGAPEACRMARVSPLDAALGVTVAVGTSQQAQVTLGVGVGVGVAGGLAVADAVGEGVGVPLGLGVTDDVSVAERLTVAVA